MDGGDAVFTSAQQLQTVWRRDKTLYTAAPARQETKLGGGKDPALLAHRGEVWAAWTAPQGLVVKRGSAQPELLDPKGTYAQLASTPGGPVVIWESNGRIVYRILR
jgi:hypothetical protein